jgi:hypothetical protein
MSDPSQVSKTTMAAKLPQKCLSIRARHSELSEAPIWTAPTR